MTYLFVDMVQLDESWLSTKISAAEFELEFVRNQMGPPDFDWVSTQSDWRAFRDQRRESDLLWRWASPRFPARFWEYEGFALMRDGKIVAHLTTNVRHTRL
jgi:hypothetical protein